MNTNTRIGGDGSVPHSVVEIAAGGHIPTAVAVHNNCVFLGYDDDRGVFQIDLRACRLVATYDREIKDSVTSLCPAPGADYLLATCANGDVLVMDTTIRAISAKRSYQEHNWVWSMHLIAESFLVSDDQGNTYVTDADALELDEVIWMPVGLSQLPEALIWVAFG